MKREHFGTGTCIDTVHIDDMPNPIEDTSEHELKVQSYFLGASHCWI